MLFTVESEFYVKNHIIITNYFVNKQLLITILTIFKTLFALSLGSIGASPTVCPFQVQLFKNREFQN